MAGGIKTKAQDDTVVHVTPALPTLLGAQKELLDETIQERLTNTSPELTKTEGKRATDVMNTIEKIGGEVQEQANALTPGDAVSIEIIYDRIGFVSKEKAGSQDRSFEVYDEFYQGLKVRIKAEKEGTTYHFRWGLDNVAFKEIKAGNVSHLSIKDLPSATKIYLQYAVTPPMGKNAIVSVNDTELEWSSSIFGITK